MVLIAIIAYHYYLLLMRLWYSDIDLSHAAVCLRYRTSIRIQVGRMITEARNAIN